MSDKPSLSKIIRKIRPSEDALLIVWDRQSGKFRVSYEGSQMHVGSLTSLLANISHQVQGQVDDTGFWKPSLGEQTTETQEETVEWTPPWMKN